MTTRSKRCLRCGKELVRKGMPWRDGLACEGCGFEWYEEAEGDFMRYWVGAWPRTGRARGSMGSWEHVPEGLLAVFNGEVL